MRPFNMKIAQGASMTIFIVMLVLIALCNLAADLIGWAR